MFSVGAGSVGRCGREACERRERYKVRLIDGEGRHAWLLATLATAARRRESVVRPRERALGARVGTG